VVVATAAAIAMVVVTEFADRGLCQPKSFFTRVADGAAAIYDGGGADTVVSHDQRGDKAHREEQPDGPFAFTRVPADFFLRDRSWLDDRGKLCCTNGSAAQSTAAARSVGMTGAAADRA